MTATEDLTAVEVCTDCYMAHHYGAHEINGEWFAGETDTPCDREPLALLGDAVVTDWSDSDTGEGYTEFAWGRCDGCGSTLGGSRYRLALWPAEEETRVDIVDGWSVEYDAPTLRILEGDTVRFESHEWNPNMADPREDALSWAAAVADPHSGLTIEEDDSDAYSNSVRYVREHTPRGFADECSMLAEEHDHQLAAGRCMQAGCSYRDETAEGFRP